MNMMDEVEEKKGDDLKVEKENKITKIPRNSIMGFIDWMEANNYAYNTVSKYSKYINRLLKSDGKKTFVSPLKFKSFLEIKTNLVYQSAIKNFIEFLEDKYGIEIDRFRYPRIKTKYKETFPPTMEEIKILINAMPDEDGLYKFKLSTYTMSKTGMRSAEIVGLKIKNIDFVTWSKDKTKKGKIILTDTKYNYERTIPISNDLMRKLAKQCEDPENKGYTKDKDSFVFDFGYFWFLKRRKRDKIRKQRNPDYFCYDESVWHDKYIEKSVSYYRKIMREISFKVLGKVIHTHMLRHAYASHLDSKGVRGSIIQRLLGHKNLSTTSVYLHPTEEEMEVGIIED